MGVKNHEADTKYDYQLNTELLRWEAFAFSDNTVSTFISVGGVIIFVIMFTSVFCIRNSFVISITEKMRMYGELASVGATKKQIKKSVIAEAMLLGIIGVPLGVVSGIFAIFVLLKIVGAMLGEYLFEGIDGILLGVNIWSIVISVILGFVTIYLSAFFSAKKASKVKYGRRGCNSHYLQIQVTMNVYLSLITYPCINENSKAPRAEFTS